MHSNAPFDATAHGYDAEFTETPVGRMQRAIVHDFLEANFEAAAFRSQPPSLLELNCGTGADALWFARRGWRVLATDISAEMVAVAQAKIEAQGFENQAKAMVCPIEDLADSGLSGHGGFDLVFSNFGGLNCVSPENLRAFGAILPQLLKPGGCFVAVVMGRFCCWETLYFLAKLNFRAAFRRLSKKPVQARLDAQTSVKTWYYAPQELEKLLHDASKPETQNSKPETRPDKIGAIPTAPVGFWLPPSYLDPLFRRFPRVLAALNFLEKKCRGRFWASGADHFLILIKT